MTFYNATLWQDWAIVLWYICNKFSIQTPFGHITSSSHPAYSIWVGLLQVVSTRLSEVSEAVRPQWHSGIHAMHVRRGTPGFTSVLKEGVLRFSTTPKNQSTQEPWASTLPLDYLSRIYNVMNCRMLKLWWNWISHSSNYEKYSHLGLMLCSLVVYQCFGSRYCLHLQGQRARQASKKQAASRRWRQHMSRHYVNLYHYMM
jgi:hypothetical protein